MPVSLPFVYESIFFRFRESAEVWSAGLAAAVAMAGVRSFGRLGCYRALAAADSRRGGYRYARTIGCDS